MWKGKAKATDDYTDPPITYRHLLSNSLGVKDPLRVIALCDCDAFYAACEMIRLGVDQDKPLVVLQWDSIIAVNYPARKFGISRMAKIQEAKRLCPELIVVHVATFKEGATEPGYWDDVDSRTHKVSLDYYRRESSKVIAMFKENLPNGEVEKASIDEAFIDFTRPVREMLLEKYPYLASVPEDAVDGLDTPLPPPPPIIWDVDKLGTVVPIDPQKSETDNDQETLLLDAEDRATWHDVALQLAGELMNTIRKEILTKLGYYTTAGLARNKFLAKLSASYKKHDNQTILRNAAIANYLKPMPFQKIRFLGGKLGDALAKEYDVSTVGDLLSISLEEMQTKFGEQAVWIYEVLRGIDRSEVKEKAAINKSMLASKNLPRPVTTASEGHHWIRVLAAELALRLNEARQASPALWPKTLVLHARQGYETARSKQASFPFSREITVDVIAFAADKLWKELFGSGITATPFKVTGLQLAFTGVEAGESGQRSIQGFLLKRQRDAEPAAFGPRLANGCVTTARAKRGASEALHADLLSFTCSRCGKQIALPETHSGGGEFANTDALAKLRMEHDDFHMALDMSREGESPSPVKKTKTTKKRKGAEDGIARFFKRNE